MSNVRNLHGSMFSLLFGGVAGVLVLFFWVGSLEKDVNLEDLALGKATTPVFSKVGDHSIHCKDFTDLSLCLDGYKLTRKDDELILWLGNSQVHSINQMKEGDETAVSILHRRLRNKDKYLMVFSQPNANFQEHYVLSESLFSDLPVKTLILPVVFDDMRETGIRDSLLDAFNDIDVVSGLNETEIGRDLIMNNGDHDSAGNDMAALEDTVQEKVEMYLNEKMSAYSEVWNDRASLRGSLLHTLYNFRNSVFGINPSTIRKMIPGRYKKNLMAIGAILSKAKNADIDVLLYVVPLRDDVKAPYDSKQYNKFKHEMQKLAGDYGFRIANLEGIVPPQYWGEKKSTTVSGKKELDFMHFQAGGHQLLSDALHNELEVMFKNGSNK